MDTFNSKKRAPEPSSVSVTKQTLRVELTDGRTISVPTQWFPRLFHGTSAEWKNIEFSHGGIHWPDLNEDISIEALLNGEKSGESRRSIRKWLGYRAKGLKEPIPELPLPPDIERELEEIGVLKTSSARIPAASRHKKAG
jgi:Protein of unknown function (DUF2442)